MENEWILLIGAVSLALIIFFIRQNRKDEKSFVDKLNNDYRKSKDEEGDAEIDEVKK